MEPIKILKGILLMKTVLYGDISSIVQSVNNANHS